MMRKWGTLNQNKKPLFNFLSEVEYMSHILLSLEWTEQVMRYLFKVSIEVF